jgi:hypothetical protein
VDPDAAGAGLKDRTMHRRVAAVGGTLVREEMNAGL